MKNVKNRSEIYGKNGRFLPPSCHEWQIIDPREVFLRLFGSNLPWLLHVRLVIHVIFFTKEMLHIGCAGQKIPLELLVCSIGRCGAAPLGHKDISAKIYIMKLPATAQQKISKKSNKTKI